MPPRSVAGGLVEREQAVFEDEVGAVVGLAQFEADDRVGLGRKLPVLFDHRRRGQLDDGAAGQAVIAEIDVHRTVGS